MKREVLKIRLTTRERLDYITLSVLKQEECLRTATRTKKYKKMRVSISSSTSLSESSVFLNGTNFIYDGNTVVWCKEYIPIRNLYGLIIFGIFNFILANKSKLEGAQ